MSEDDIQHLREDLACQRNEPECPKEKEKERKIPSNVQTIVRSAEAALAKDLTADERSGVTKYIANLSLAVSQEWIQGCM